ncbi:hypothetical protein CKAN_02400000 [Cinnamomum micranthum f. kanehirae]|uniref:Uncharacterized protein n=1 Tax=Cinnamomum micranthum f. kanehirae TaxID=337451 RepID=A0A443PV93_9MAGN|nr:hypothetical protein CKAN_02400000 [Cinnamomum micranthum f. kanehirae]
MGIQRMMGIPVTRRVRKGRGTMWNRRMRIMGIAVIGRVGRTGGEPMGIRMMRMMGIAITGRVGRRRGGGGGIETKRHTREMEKDIERERCVTCLGSEAGRSWRPF